MPIYEYKCQTCDTRFEQYVRSLSTQHQVVCPVCGGAEIKKEWSVFGLGREGSGSAAGLSGAPPQCGSPST